MNLILNIGLNTNTGGKLVVDHLFRDLERAGFDFGPSKAKFYQSATEQTLVLPCEFGGESVIDAVERLCVRAWQDAIAFWDEDLQLGYLSGPKAAEWGGKFDAEQFIMPDGRKLSEQWKSIS